MAKFETVTNNFDERLLSYLNPPFPKASILAYGGNHKGSVVDIELNFLLFKQRWVSEITDFYQEESVMQFVDVGKKLPFFLSKWKHKHRIEQRGDYKTVVIDEVNYWWKNKFLSVLIFPAIYFQFLYRKPRYSSYFKLKFVTRAL